MLIGILGYGSAGKRHADNAIALGHDVRVYDPDKKLGLLQYDREKVINAADAVIIASPSDRHWIDLSTCVVASKPALVEKPIALPGQSKDIANILNAAGEAELPVAVGYNLRFHPKIADLWDQDHDWYYLSLTCCQYTENIGALTNGCLAEWTTHELDLSRFLLSGADLRIIDKHISRFSVDLGLFEWVDGGCHVHIHSDTRAHQRVRQVLAVSEDKSVHIDLEADPVTNDHYRVELENFLRYVETGKPGGQLATGNDGLAALKLCEKADNVRLEK